MCARKYDLRSASIGIEACIDELQADINNGLVIQELAAQNPVSTMETRQMRPNMNNLPVILEIRKVRVPTHGRLLHEELYRRVDSGPPGLQEQWVRIRVKSCVLEEILEVGICASAPGDVCTYGFTSAGIDALRGESW